MATLAARLSKELAIIAAHDRSKWLTLQDPEERKRLAEIARQARMR